MNTSIWKSLLAWELKANVILWLINAIIVFTLTLMGNDLEALVSSMLFSKLTLLEAGLVFLIGGILAFSGSISTNKSKEFILKKHEEWSIEKLKASEKIANKYILLAIIILIVAITISLIGY